MKIEDLDRPSGKGMQAHPHVVYTIHLVPFDEPYIEAQEITLDGLEEITKPV